MPACVHCGEECGNHPVVWNNLNFCCNGCKTVYELLHVNKLYTYYKIEETPGIKVENNDFRNKYAYLDNEEVKEKLFEFTQDNIRKVTLYIPSIHCSSCIWLLENLNTLHKGIKQSMVNFVKKEVNITFNENEISLRKIVELLASIHYIPLITLESAEKNKNKQNNKQLLAKIGVAGFAFGNTMMLSLPEYLPGSYFLEENFKTVFGFLNLILALPIVFYSGNDYLLSAFKNLKRKILNIDLPISIGILAIFFQSSYEIISGSGAGYMDSLSGFVFFLLIGKWYQSKTYQALSFDRDYKSYFPIAVTKMNNGTEESILLEKLKKNDHILIRNQELIPADGILTKGTAFIDYSFVTGEAKPLKKEEGDELYAGGRQIGPSIEIKIQNEVKQSKLTKLWDQNHKDNNRSELTPLIDKVSKNFTYAVLSIAFLTLIFWIWKDSSIALRAFTSVLIVACPCALALSIPFSFGNTMRVFGKQGFYLKNTDVVENLSKIDTVVFDKTGTITHANALNIVFKGDILTSEEEIYVKSISRHSTHPLSLSVNKSIQTSVFYETEDFREIPSRGILGKVHGRLIRLGSYEFVQPGNQPTDSKQNSTRVYLSLDDNVKGYFSVENKYRDGLKELISDFKKNKNIFLISGDNDAELERLIPYFEKEENIRFRQSPDDKLQFIRKLKDEGKKILMIGDGLNDAGALLESHVGISIADDIYHFSPACDAILEANKFHKLVDFLKFSKKSIKTVYFSYFLSVIYNLAGLSFAVQGLLSPIIAAVLMPASSVSVVAYVSFSILLKARKLQK